MMSEINVDTASSTAHRLTVSSIRGVTARRGSSLSFHDLDIIVQDKEKQILHSVAGSVQPGEMLAIMGASGAGKTTLLNVLAGRLKSSYTQTGQVLIDGEPLNKHLKRRVSYVLQDDVFFSFLTLKQALTYSALLRLPSSMTKQDKLRMVDHAIQVLGVQNCQNTIFGSAFYSGLSGGEKKRANIACELLTDPAILMLDEPTSGLDSSTALSLLKTLHCLANDEAKTLIATIHQPSTQCYYEFDKLLLLCEGRVAYFGPTKTVLDYFASIGYPCPAYYNPADYALELVTGNETQRKTITESWQQRSDSTTFRPPIPQPLGVITELKEPAAGFPNGTVGNCPNKLEEGCHKEQLNSYMTKQLSDHKLYRQNSYSEAINTAFVAISKFEYKVSERQKFSTSFWTQLNVLSRRSFRQARPDILSKLAFIQTIVVGLFISLIWFQVPRDEKNIRDRMAFLFFHSTYWGFQPVGQAALAFSQEKAVVMKERAAGSYRLSAYYIAKSFSELPLIFVLPFIEFTLAYFVAGMHGFDRWIISYFILITSCFAAQSLGLFVGTLISNLKEALTAAQISLLISMLVSGFYVLNFPSWIQWIQYFSFLTYTFDALLSMEFLGSEPFRCDPVDSSYSVCSNITVGLNGTDYLITGEDILEDLRVVFKPWQSVLCIILYALIFRFLTYLALRHFHKPN